MIMLSVYFTGKAPFTTMFFHGMLRDLEGRKFSKSLGNGIEPQYLIDKWGVDASRMALYTYSIPGRDGRVNKAILDERGKNFRNFGTKLRNIARFVLELAPETIPAGQKMSEDDFEILAELDKTIKKVTKNLDNLELHLAVDELYEFVWHTFADKYIESTKERRGDAQPTLENVLKQVLILLHPFMPFLTEEIYQQFENKRESIMLEDWPSTS
jgi:valyl-tRNA synthetase